MTSAELEPSAECTLRGILGGLPDEDLDRVSAWCAGVTDWPALLAASREHGVGGVLLAGLRRANIAGPRDAVESHERLLFVESMRQDVMRQTLEDVLAALARHGVANVALKGPLLASRLYDAAVVRPSTDSTCSSRRRRSMRRSSRWGLWATRWRVVRGDASSGNIITTCTSFTEFCP